MEKLAGNRGKGRPKGTANKATKELKDMILGALDDVGGQSYLADQAIKNPTAFLSLIGKVLPSPTSNKVTNNIQTSGYQFIVKRAGNDTQ